jgi:excisionase family DNA binding protein
MKIERLQPCSRLLLTDQVAIDLGVSKRTVRRLIARRELVPAASVGRSGCIPTTSPPTSIGSAAGDHGDRGDCDDRAGPLCGISSQCQVILGNTPGDISSRMVVVRIPVMSLRSSRVLPRPVLSSKHVPEGEINGHLA